MSQENIKIDNCSTDIEQELLAAKAEVEIAKAEAKAVKADAEATKAEAEALMAEAEALMAEAKVLKAEAEAVIAEAKNGHGVVSRSTKVDLKKVQPQLTVEASQISGSILVSSIKENEKFPKERIVLYHDEYKKLGITNFRATIIHDYNNDSTTTFSVNGEYDGKTKNTLLIVVMAFNEKNELIGVTFRENIKENIRSHKTYSTYIEAPNSEGISRVEIKIIKNLAY